MKKIDGKDYFVCTAYSDFTNWTLAFIQPYAQYPPYGHPAEEYDFVPVLVIIVFCIAMAYYFSRNLYRPLGKLVADTEKYSDPIQLAGQKRKYKENELKIIDGAIKRLFDQKNELLTKYEIAFPYFKNNFIGDLLSDKNFNTGKFKSILELLGVYFVHTGFVSVILDFENVEFTDAIRARLESWFADYREGLIYILSGLSNSRIVVLINTEYDIEMVYSILLKMKDKFNYEDIQLTISVGKRYEALDDIYASYSEALHQIENKFFIGKNEIITDYEPRRQTRYFSTTKGLRTRCWSI